MKNPKKIALALASLTALGAALAGCGSGDSDVDPKAMESRNSQRGGAAPGGGPAAPAAGTTAGQ